MRDNSEILDNPVNFSLGTNRYKEIFVYNIQICAYNDSKHINLNDKEEKQLWITKNW